MNSAKPFSVPRFLCGAFCGVLSSWLLIISGISGAVTLAGCPPIESFAGWAPNSFIDYRTSTFTSAEISQIDTGMGNWTTHNNVAFGYNCSGVGFIRVAPAHI